MPEDKNLRGLSGSYLSLVSPDDVKFDVHKRSAVIVSRLYGEPMGPSGFSVGRNGRVVNFSDYSLQIHNCGHWLKFVQGEGEKIKLIDAQFCKIAFCPMCQWRRALKWRAKFLTLLPSLQKQFPKHRWLFLTLTIRNCELSDLRDTVKYLNQSFKRLWELKALSPFEGCIKSLEITRAWDCYDKFTGEYLGRHGSKWVYQYNLKFPNTPLHLEPTTEVHPHFHVVALVSSSYFNGNYYLSQDEWVKLWRQSLRVDYNPVLDVRAIRPKRSELLPSPENFEADPESDKTGMVKAICEVVKYTVKVSDLLGVNDSDHNSDNVLFLKSLTEQLYKLRRIEYRGVLKSIAKDLESAYNDDNLISINDETSKDDCNYQELTFKWYQALEKYVMIDP